MDELAQNQETTEKYNEVSERIKTLKENATKIRATLSSVDKNTALLDKQWILCAFPLILAEFKKKSQLFSKEKDCRIKSFSSSKLKKRVNWKPLMK